MLRDSIVNLTHVGLELTDGNRYPNGSFFKHSISLSRILHYEKPQRSVRDIEISRDFLETVSSPLGQLFSWARLGPCNIIPPFAYSGALSSLDLYWIR